MFEITVSNRQTWIYDVMPALKEEPKIRPANINNIEWLLCTTNLVLPFKMLENIQTNRVKLHARKTSALNRTLSQRPQNPNSDTSNQSVSIRVIASTLR